MILLSSIFEGGPTLGIPQYPSVEPVQTQITGVLLGGSPGNGAGRHGLVLGPHRLGLCTGPGQALPNTCLDYAYYTLLPVRSPDHARHPPPECCSVLRGVAECCGVLRCVAVCCGVLRCVAVCCGVLQCVSRPSKSQGALLVALLIVLQCVAVCCSQVCCSVSQCVAVCVSSI